MSLFSSLWWKQSDAPPKIDTASAVADEQAVAEHAELARRFAASPILDDMPRHVAILERQLERRNQSGIFRLVYRAKLTLTAAQLRSGSLQPEIAVRCERIASTLKIKDAQERNVRAIALSMEALECDSRQMPFSIVWRATPHCSVVAAAGEHWLATQRRGSKRHVPSKSLLSTPVGVENLSLNIAFTSFEAVGFNATHLMQNIAALTPSGDYRIPITYIYAGLLRNVHSACVLAEQRARLSPLEVETAPVSTYQVAHDNEYMLMSGEDLQRAVAYIEKNLVPTNYDFNYVEPELFVQPFGGGKWLDEAQRAQSVEHNRAAVSSGQLASVDAPPPPVSASIVFVVYVGVVLENGFNNGFAMPAVPTSMYANRSTTTTKPVKRRNTNHNEDDDNDDDDGDDENSGVLPDGSYRSGERRDIAKNNGVMTMSLAGGSVSEDDNGDESEATAREQSVSGVVTAAAVAAPAVPSSKAQETTEGK